MYLFLCCFFAALFCQYPSFAQGDVSESTINQLNFQHMKVTELRQLAETGDANAQFRLGELYESGSRLAHSEKKAIYWYEKAAEQDNIQAQFKLATLYRNDRMANEYDRAVIWYTKAADHGHIGAQLELSLMYANGLGLRQDFAIARALALFAAANGRKFGTELSSTLASIMSRSNIKRSNQLVQRMQQVGVSAAIDEYKSIRRQ